MTGMFNELVDGKRVFVATDGRHLHKVEFPGREAMFAGVPVGKNLGFKADSKQFTFTEEIDRVFPNYKRVIPDIAGIEPFELWVRKTPEIGYTDALYTLYSKNIRMNALHVEAMALPDVPGWKAYYGCARDVVVCTQDIKGVLYTVVSAGLRI
jgi:hypothetical protein